MCLCEMKYLYRDAAAVARLVVGAFTISPSSGVVPPGGQVVVTVECAADQAGHMSEVSHVCALISARSLTLSVSLCTVYVCLFVLYVLLVFLVATIDGNEASKVRGQGQGQIPQGQG